MKKYLLPEQGDFYKANLHCHTNLSDGKLSPQEVKELYRSMGYSVVAFTDHDILIPHPELNDENFLALNGFEVEINEPKKEWPHTKVCHICFVGLEQDNITQPYFSPKYLFGNAPKNQHLITFDPNEPFFERCYSGEKISELMQKVADRGFFVTYNHPAWSLEGQNEYQHYHGMHAFEIVNGGCFNAGYDEYNPHVYDDFLRKGQRIYAIAADDNHNSAPKESRYSDSGHGFLMIKAERLEYRLITKALQAGNFYASQGPEIYDLWYEDGKVHYRCSPMDKIVLTYETRDPCVHYAENGELLTEGTFQLKKEYEYFRLTFTDSTGRHANTNAYFKDEL